ncbi:hypothetical protein AMATHDRAFT_140392 [Amanita thiersii Skay4041]|uniref:Uncharacterized protein n=1 Tax=Amanita thiersii Skay4041 TaxID=703135 RepID=A0A2A9NX73_9AGAR|nr:hypothetical protein AMATHDRAFT_140392 [Amanita thiersii Skay4041]
MQSGGGPIGERTISVSGINSRDLGQLLSSVTSPSLGGYYEAESDENNEGVYEDDDDDDDYFNSAHNVQQWYSPHKEPQPAGLDLLASGDFGRIAVKDRIKKKKNIAKQLFSGNMKPLDNLHKEDIVSNLIPNTSGTSVASFSANIYTGQYSTDSSFYYTCGQDFRLHVFDTTSPLDSTLSRRVDAGLNSRMLIRKSVQGRHGRWTITDANLSPDNERMIYSSITPTVYMTNVSDDSTGQIPIPFGESSLGSFDVFGIWSCRFSADGNEVVAGGSGKIFVYDLLANRRTVKIDAHDDDVNSCCWADTASGNVLVSASDDTFLKVWDRRSLGSSQKPSGVLIGHTEGLTYVSAKGDGRYIISNGKDQAMRLWDLRKMRSSQDFEAVRRHFFGVRNFDYRYPVYPKPRYSAHPKDCSVMTYRGHSVLRTLIRCHFSPAETTGGQYLYSGSADGRIHIWSLDGTIVQVLDRSKTLPMTFDPSEPEPVSTRGSRNNVCVRDVSWHSQEPILMSAAWESGHGGSVVARHEWKGLLKKLRTIEDWQEKQRTEQEDPVVQRRQYGVRRHFPGSFEDDDDSH